MNGEIKLTEECFNRDDKEFIIPPLVLGDGNIKLWNGDCLKAMKDIQDESVDLIVTDPPYKVTSRGNTGNTGGMLKGKKFSSGMVFNHNDIEIEDYLPIFYQKLKTSAHCYIMTNHRNLVHFLKVIDEWKDPNTNEGFHFIKSLIWDKGNKIMGHFYMSQFEYILFLRKGAAFKINNCGTSDILSYPNKKTKDKDGNNIHDTEKPVNLMSVLIENSSQPNDVVLEPFMGSGSVGVACVNTNRKFIGIELDENYFNIAKDRIQKAIEEKQLRLF